MVKVLKDPQQKKLLDNPNYSRILSIMRDQELTIKEIHKQFNKNYEDKKALMSIYRYMQKLVANDLVFVSKEKIKRGHLIESYYSRTAKFFLFADKLTDKNILNATIELFKSIYTLNEEKEKKLQKLLYEHGENSRRYHETFYAEFGGKILEIEKKYGFKVMKEAAYATHELTYFKKNPEVLDRLFNILEE